MIGGDLKVEKYRFRARPQNMNFVLFPTDSTTKQISMFSVIMILIKMSLDTDSFFFYEDMFRCGIIEALIISIIIMLFIQLSIHLFTRCWFYGTAYNFPDIWTCVFGSKTLKFIPILLNVISYLIYVAWYSFEIHNGFSTFIKEVWPDSPSFLSNKWFLCYIINALTAFPFLFARKFVSLVAVAYVGNVAFVVSTICLIILLFRTIDEYKFNITVNTIGKIKDENFPYLSFTTLFSSDPSALFTCAGTIMTAFYMHPILDLVFSEMKHPTVYRCLSSTWIVNIISVFIYYGIGLISYFIVQIHFQEATSVFNTISSGIIPPNFYNRPFNMFIYKKLQFTDMNNENVFFNFPRSYAEAMIGQIASYVVVITSNILYTYFLAGQISSLVVNQKNDNNTPLIISGIVVILFGIGINFMDSSSMDFLDFIAKIAFLILGFILPSFFYLKLYRFTKPFWGIASVVLLVIGVPLSVVVLYYTALQIW